MPQILELKTIDDQLWARIPKFADEKGAVTLWTEAEKNAVLKNERFRCIEALHVLNDT